MTIIRGNSEHDRECNKAIFFRGIASRPGILLPDKCSSYVKTTDSEKASENRPIIYSSPQKLL